MTKLFSGRATLLSANTEAPYFRNIVFPTIEDALQTTRMRLTAEVDVEAHRVNWLTGDRQFRGDYDFLDAIVDSDLLIVDITTPHRSLAYFLGVRDGLTVAPSFLVSAGHADLPIDENWSRHLVDSTFVEQQQQRSPLLC